DKVGRAILHAVAIKFGGGPVGLSTLAIAVGEEPETVEDAYEPFLLQEGFLQRTPRGRIATDRAYQHLGVERDVVPSPQGTLLGG
ncbi:MAG: Holliday junction DNA helicase RuvB C-terminal domain-containing protein, partial [Actinomycetota bacterium]|nr:Holliday junction DNA helicase RuvB C-terminal domain-containing protein [Actinomycetota bacterium]